MENSINLLLSENIFTLSYAMAERKRLCDSYSFSVLYLPPSAVSLLMESLLTSVPLPVICLLSLVELRISHHT